MIGDRIKNAIMTREAGVMLSLFVVAFLARCVGMHYGYWHGDERINEACKVLTGQLVPGQHFYPPLLNYINAFFFAVLYGFGLLLGIWHEASDFRAQYFLDPTPFYLVARAVTCALGAAVAPIFYRFARSLGLTSSKALLVGAFGVFMPGALVLCHFSKSDVPMAVFAVLVSLLVLRRQRQPGSRRLDVAMGCAVAVTLSFKHSYVFILLPLMIGHGILLAKRESVRQAVQSLVVAGLTAIPVLCLLNIGVLLDLKEFLAYQEIQAQMSVRKDVVFIPAWSTWFSINAGALEGINPIMVVLWCAFPLYLRTSFCQLKQKPTLLLIWLSVAVALITVVMMSGTRQHAGLWIPYFTMMQLFAATMLVDALRSPTVALKRLGWVVLIATSGMTLLGTLGVWKQALARPVAEDVATFVRANYSDARILTAPELRLPQSAAARDFEQERLNRLAAKYNTPLGDVAEERRVYVEPAGAVFRVGMPQVLDGLVHTDDESLGSAIRAYAWPLQPEEWRLDHWLERGFSVFVVRGFDTPARRALIRDFHEELGRRCVRIADFEPTKPLFVEFPVTIFKFESR